MQVGPLEQHEGGDLRGKKSFQRDKDAPRERTTSWKTNASSFKETSYIFIINLSFFQMLSFL